MSGKALDGIRVVDLTRHMAGPNATIALADHGADVIKVESLPRGEPMRTSGAYYVGDESALYLMWNRGKRSVALDLRRPEGIAVVDRLVRDADVFIENYRPGVAEEIGLGYERLAAINPRLVYCSISAFGSHGPLASLPGTDPVVQAMSGIMSVTGESDRPASIVGVPIADFVGSMVAFQGVLLALHARERIGRGQRVDVSMLTALISSFATRLAEHWATGEDPARFGGAHGVHVPYQVFATADGEVMAGSWGGDSWPRFCEAIGREDLLEDERFATGPSRRAHREELVATIAETMRTRTTAGWEPEFRSRGALFAPVNTFSQILGHPQIEQLGLVQQVEHPTLGPIPQLAPVIGLSETPGGLSLPPPMLGQHTREVLRETGFDDDEVAALLDDGIAVQYVPGGG